MATNTVDGELLKLANEANAKIKALGKSDARESAYLVTKEELADAMVEALGRTLAMMTPEEKVAAFDRIAKGRIDAMVEQVKAKLEDRYCDDDDDEHYLVEEVETAIFGKGFHEAFMTMDKVFAAKPKSKARD